MSAYYNEIDTYAAQWLRNLIDAGHIASGVVDTRSIEDVRPRDLDGFTQCHFFAGIGVWSYALRLAGWSDDRPVWTGSCPCQPFSSAGKGAGFDDERHLWPAWFHLISECRPAVVFGEQVASKDAEPWIDLVQDDLEGLGYAIGAIPFPSAGVGAPHIRDRLYWVADADGGRQPARRQRRAAVGHRSAAQPNCSAGELGHAERTGLAQRLGLAGVLDEPGGTDAGQAVERAGIHAGGLANNYQERRGRREGLSPGCLDDGPDAGRIEGDDGLVCSGEAGVSRAATAGPTNGLWEAADWLLCRDGKWRPVEPGSFPLADGPPARVGRLRAYGNAINAQAAAEFIRCVM